MKFSIIVPVYNVEKYLTICLDSIINQTYNDFEIIVVNDGSPDNSQSIIDKYKNIYPQKIKSFIKENGGLSDARNFGVNKATGEYIIFVDSDDYIEKELLDKINNKIKEDSSLDLIGYNFKIKYDNNKEHIIKKPIFNNLNGNNAIKSLIEGKEMFEPAWSYAFKRKFWNDSKFKFSTGRFHEDFGLIPEIVIKANKISTIEYIGYNYIQTDNSIMRTNDYKKIKKKAWDMIKNFDDLKNISNKFINDIAIQDLFNSYIANAVINQINMLYDEEKESYINELKKRNVFNLLLEDTLPRKIKKKLIKIKYRSIK